jgi:hypothetical protein
MYTFAAAVKNHVTASHSKSGACKRSIADWKGKTNPLGE